jgi:hypothetical protein
MSTISQNQALLKHLFALLQAHRCIFKQERSYQRAVALVLAEVFVFARLPHLGLDRCSCRSHPLVAWLPTLVAQHPLADLPRCPLAAA